MSDDMRSEIIDALMATSGLSEGVAADAIMSVFRSWQSQQAQSDAVGYVLPSGMKQLKKDHPATIYAPENAIVPGSHPIWLYESAPAAAAVPDELPMPAYSTIDRGSKNYKAGWNACRKAMLASPVSLADQK